MRRVRFRDDAGFVRDGNWKDHGIICAGQRYDPERVDVLPPVDPSKIVGVSTNHVDLIEQLDYERPERPKLFIKTPNTVSGHRDTVTLASTDEFNYEAEFAVVIGTQCRNVSKDSALSTVEGVTCFNDITNRSDQDRYGVRFKAFDNSAVVGPVVVPTTDVPADARIQLRINGETKQDATRDGLIFDIPEVIQEVTSYMTLEPGDVIPMGSPGGVGKLRDGDEVEIEVEGIGTLVHDVRMSKTGTDSQYARRTE